MNRKSFLTACGVFFMGLFLPKKALAIPEESVPKEGFKVIMGFNYEGREFRSYINLDKYLDDNKQILLKDLDRQLYKFERSMNRTICRVGAVSDTTLEPYLK